MQENHICNEQIVVKLQQILQSLQQQINANKKSHQNEVSALKSVIQLKDKQISDLKKQINSSLEAIKSTYPRQIASNKALKRISLHRLDSTKMNSTRLKHQKSQFIYMSDLNCQRNDRINEIKYEPENNRHFQQIQVDKFEQLASLSKGLLLSIRKSLEKYNDFGNHAKKQVINQFQLDDCQKEHYRSGEIKRNRSVTSYKLNDNQKPLNTLKRSIQRAEKKNSVKSSKQKQNKQNLYENKKIIDVLIPVKKISFLTPSLNY